MTDSAVFGVTLKNEDFTNQMLSRWSHRVDQNLTGTFLHSVC